MLRIVQKLLRKQRHLSAGTDVDQHGVLGIADAPEEAGLVIADAAEDRKAGRQVGLFGRLGSQSPQGGPRGTDFREQRRRQAQGDQEIVGPGAGADVEHTAAGGTGWIGHRLCARQQSTR